VIHAYAAPSVFVLATSIVWLLVVVNVTLLLPLLVRLMVYCLPAIPTALGSVTMNAAEVASARMTESVNWTSRPR